MISFLSEPFEDVWASDSTILNLTTIAVGMNFDASEGIGADKVSPVLVKYLGTAH